MFHVSDIRPCAETVAGLLAREGAAAGRPVAVVTRSARALTLVALAAPRLPAPVFPIDPALPEAAIEDLLAQAGTDFLVGERPLAGARFLASEEVLAARTSHGAAGPLWPDSAEIALILATSGSSGRPKAVMLSGANLHAAARASAAAAPLRAGDIWFACLPLFHIGGFSILVRTVLAGAEALVAERFEAGAVLAALRERQVTHLSLVPAMLAKLLATEESPAPESLRHLILGGAALAPELARRAAARGWPVQPSYGMSETASQLATLAALPPGWQAGFVGPPLTGAEVALDGAGRLKVRGATVMAGYANPALAPGDGLEDGWFTTSDLAEIDDCGAITVLGRADEAIVTGGKKVMPQPVEALLATLSGIAAAGVAGRPDPIWGEVVTAVYAGTLEERAVLSWCRQNVSGAMRPRAALCVPALPVLASGKPDRSAIKRLAAGKDVVRDDADAGGGRQR
ncbi:class I adenylate-forming enzyme family protein [Afifella pfennigii]|uniref:class I adenylate-forming enzyme family protein n=1 Tax=Afifella pfennigii TaxID=209897 RepID=UPI000690A5AA|nr:AMP-binding protein [Afifella pfennigii]